MYGAQRPLLTVPRDPRRWALPRFLYGARAARWRATDARILRAFRCTLVTTADHRRRFRQRCTWLTP